MLPQCLLPFFFSTPPLGSPRRLLFSVSGRRSPGIRFILSIEVFGIRFRLAAARNFRSGASLELPVTMSGVVVGLDVGNDNCVVASVRNRGVEVLLNEESKRETPSVVCFGDKQRFLGLAGAASTNRHPRSTISQIKRLVGRRFQDPAVQADLKRFPFAASECPDDGGVLIQIQYLGERRAFTPVQVLAMLFSHLKSIAEKSLEAPLSDCVIGIPSYFTDLQRRAYVDAATIAGLKPLRLLHDCTATALGYGIYRADAGPPSNPFRVVFIDVGHSDTQVAVVEFAAGKMKVLSHAFDANLGGRDFDEVLFEHFAKHFVEQYKIDVHSNVRASIRLRATCEKVKKILSANSETPLSIECLMDDKDVKGFITRDEFEKLSTELLNRFLEPCKKALEHAKLNPEAITAVELVGSGSRIPSIIRILTDFFGREPGRTLNASECVARGCALHAAMLSPVFKVREYEVQDSFPFSVNFATEEGPIMILSNIALFCKGQPIPSVKLLSFFWTKPFKLEAFYANDSELPPDASTKISSFQIGPFHISEGKKAKVKVKFRINLHGIVSVESATLFEDEKDNLVLKDGSQMENSELNSIIKSDAVTMDGSSVHTEAESVPSSATGKRLHERHELQISDCIYGGMSSDMLSEAQEQERVLVYQDRLMEQTKDKKNALEAYVYEIRNKLFERYRSFASDAEREGISARLQQTEDWLYEDGDDETVNVYTHKLEELKKLVDPVESRYKDEEARVQATRELLNCIVENRRNADSLTTDEKDVILYECGKAEQWLHEKSKQQDSLPKNVDPVLWSHEIKKMMDALHISCQNILKLKSSPSRADNSTSDHPTRDDMQID